jgi:hypothetical protein
MFHHENLGFHIFEFSLERDVSPPYSWLLVSIMFDASKTHVQKNVLKTNPGDDDHE